MEGFGVRKEKGEMFSILYNLKSKKFLKNHFLLNTQDILTFIMQQIGETNKNLGSLNKIFFTQMHLEI